MQRFLVTDLSAAQPGELRTLDDEEAHHLRTVLRGQAGDGVELFDGTGGSCRGVVQEISKRAVRVRIDESPRYEPVLRPDVWLAVSPPKQDRFRWLVEKATELGVSRLIPLLAQRTVVSPGEGKLTRLHGAVVQACKQCGRNRLMAIDNPRSWADFWPLLSPDRTSSRVLIADPTGPSSEAVPASTPERFVILIGPEGGWTETELREAAAQGAAPISLGRFTLRTETAAIAAAARWGPQRLAAGAPNGICPNP